MKLDTQNNYIEVQMTIHLKLKDSPGCKHQCNAYVTCNLLLKQEGSQEQNINARGRMI